MFEFAIDRAINHYLRDHRDMAPIVVRMLAGK
jgi:hypothetical protein